MIVHVSGPRSRRCWGGLFGVLLVIAGAVWASPAAAADNERPAAKARSADDRPVAGAADKSELPAVGDPLAAGKIELLEQEMINGIRGRRIENEFMRFRNYLSYKLNTFSAPHTGNEVTGNCRLKWYEKLLRNPLKAPAEAERFTRELHQNVLSGPPGLARLLNTARNKLDLPDRPLVKAREAKDAADALDIVEDALVNAQVAMAAAFAPLTKSEMSELTTNLHSVLTTQNNNGHTLNNRSMGRRLVDLLERTDRDALFAAAEALAPLINRQVLDKLAELPDNSSVECPGVSGKVVRVINTPGGSIVVGGRGKNVYRLDEMGGVSCVIDLGGDDEYLEGMATVERPVLVLLDLKGNDVYRATRPGTQGSALLGASLLIDVEGNDTYIAQDLAQGSCVGGVGILVDMAGSDRYQGVRRVQGSALCGLGMLLDYEGDDDYRAAMWAQGFGHPLGFGLLDDVQGRDHYFAGGMWRDSYPETPGMEGWSQGVGAGIRQVANGGFGIILDGEGNDVYEYDYIAHGGGYWLGVGFARDFAGDDKYIGSTTTNYNGSPRTEPQFQRFACGFGCHYTIGFMFEDGGNDYYRGSIMNMGFGWDCSVGFLCEFGGNDKYEPTGTSTCGQGAQASLGVLFDYDGDDSYGGYGQGLAPSSISYHDLPGCGGNFSFLVDYGGEDTYACGARNNVYLQRGAAGGFLIDRPKEDSTAEASPESTPEKPKAQQTAAGR